MSPLREKNGPRRRGCRRGPVPGEMHLPGVLNALFFSNFAGRLQPGPDPETNIICQ